MSIFKKGLFKRPNVPLESQEGAPEAALPEDGLWLRCGRCKSMLLSAELAQNAQVCPKCGAHFHLGARQRIAGIVDQGSFQELFADVAAGDPLDFPGYGAKLEKARRQSGEIEAVVCGRARIQDRPLALFAMDPGFMMGSMGCAVGEKIARLFELALEQRLPVLGFTVSGGARMQEGILSLMQMAKVSGAVRRFGEAGLLYVCVLTDPTTGGVTASFAMEADVTLAEPGALIGFAGPRVIEQTIRQRLPQGFQTAEFLLEKGFVDRIVDRRAQREEIGRLLRLYGEADAWKKG